MCLLNHIRQFVRNGAHVFSEAARGEYNHTSARVEYLKESLANQPSGPAIDRQNLRRDRARIYRDVSTAFNEYKSNRNE